MESTHFELRAVLCTRFLSLPRFARWKESEGVARSVFLLFALPHQCCIHPLYPCVCPLVSTTITALDTTITNGKKKITAVIALLGARALAYHGWRLGMAEIGRRDQSVE